ncbi:hypothetical protein SAMN04488028_10626 [Reichenbachiella agariperforans]|uniref:DUF6984 domain-containing protein n=1 Tax=Reichenbachiella agariperforans TaxID=156994 RepID=A0A1M6TGD0_REIAG|nr:hypothetical protein [Reichenbachiella agariperforans]SHK55896.1 hypothetical protein SAMN04488028_10626 [Reichenbachiella agariperforans]
MNKSRAITSQEKAIVTAMLSHITANTDQFPVSETVTQYGDPYMGSINFDNDRPDLYDGDLVQCKYVDTDGVKVVLSLTKDKEGKLLDLDFWKENFTPLVQYPTPEIVDYNVK